MKEDSRSDPFKPMKINKNILKIAAVVLVAVICAYVISNKLAEKISRKALNKAVKVAGRYGLTLQDPRFQKVQILLPNAVRWYNASTHVMVKHDGSFEIDRNFYLYIHKTTLTLKNIMTGSYLLTLDGISLEWQNENVRKLDSFEKSGDRMYNARLEMPLKMNLTNKSEFIKQMNSLREDMLNLLKHGKCRSRIFFKGTIHFTVHDMIVDARIATKRNGNETILTMHEGDVRKLSELLKDYLEETLTDTEVTLVSQNPLRAPYLLRIRDYACATTKNAASRDDRVPKDAYRHILWAYRLTKQYKAEFAKIVTDAHEIGATDETEAEMAMDLNNNAIGIRYAQAGYKEADLLKHILSDPDVILNHAKN
ncbi:MAG: hypothetical protein WC592_07015 [Candidatus Omnitrophota bacterium]